MSLGAVPIRQPEPVRISVLPHIKETGGARRTDSEESILDDYQRQGIMKRTEFSVVGGKRNEYE